MRRTIVVLTCLASMRVASAQSAASDSIDALVRDFIRVRNVPAAAIALTRGGRVLKTAGYGVANLELGVATTEHSAFEIGSITKQFTAEALMMLVDERKVSVDDPLSKYVPEAPDAWRAITLRHLLTHTSGLHDWEGPAALPLVREYTLAEFIAVIAAHPLDFTPGSKFTYSNSAFPMLGQIIERVSGMPYERFITERIFAPAGMTETRFRSNVRLTPNRASGYVDDHGTLVNGAPLRPTVLVPNGGIVSTAADMARWNLALSRGAIVPAATLARMLVPTRLNDGSTFGGATAWFLATIDGKRMAAHNGATPAGYSSVVYRALDEELSLVVLLNIDRGDAVNQLATSILRLYR